jgi:hypothetical protein
VGLQAVEDCVAADGELVAGSLTAQVLDVLVLAVSAIADQGMAGLVGNTIIGTGRVRAREAFGAVGLVSASSSSGGALRCGRQAEVFLINRVITLVAERFGTADGAIGCGLGLEGTRGSGMGLPWRPAPAKGEAKHQRDESKQQDEHIQYCEFDVIWSHGKFSPNGQVRHVAKDARARSGAYARPVG